jgi:hypothetical protein
MEAKHTPTPWIYVRENGSPTTGQHMIAGAKPGYLAEIRDCGSGDVQANAEFIVRACNVHDALVAALQAIVEAGRVSDQSRAVYCANIARAALAKAGV